MGRGARILLVASILTAAAAVVGFIAVVVLNAFVFDEYDAYGEVDIPGSASLHLPEGEVTVSFHTLVTGQPSGAGLPVPELQMSISPPEGVDEPTVTESFGGTTTVNNDAHVRVWVTEIHEAGTYEVLTEGEVDGYISPRLAFGHDRTHGELLWLFGGLFAVGVVGVLVALIWSARVAKRARPLQP